MIWKIRDKQDYIHKRFAVFPKRIGKYRIWFRKYFVVYEFISNSIYSYYVPHIFIEEACAKKKLESLIMLYEEIYGQW